MKKNVALLVLLCASGRLALGTQEPPAALLLESVEEVLDAVVAIRGLEPKGPIEKGIQSRAEIREFLLNRAREEYPRPKVEAEGEALKMLGLIPEDMELYEFMLDLLTEQIAGYYDPHSGKLNLASWLPLEIQKPVLAHEILHAIQDQHFDLAGFLEKNEGNDDALMARTALIEGEGFVVMVAYAMQAVGMSYQDIPDMVLLTESQMPMMEAQYEVFARAPRYLKALLTFPYSYGGNFVLGLVRERSWSALEALYDAPPVSTEQILHPAKYFEEADLPRPAPESLWEEHRTGEAIYENVLGEFSLFQLLAEYLNEDVARQGADGWDGDSIRLVKEGEKGKILLIDSLWDDEREAREFFDSFCDLLEVKYEGTAEFLSNEQGDSCRLESSGRSAEARLQGDRVSSREMRR